MSSDTITNNVPSNVDPCEPEVFIGLDWGEKSHAFALIDRSGRKETGTLEHSAENLHQWLTQLAIRYCSRPVVLAIESSRGPVITALLQYPWLTLYPVNPATSARYRKAFRPSGAKDDIPDAEVLLDLVRHHRDKLRPLEPQDPTTRLLMGLCETRRKIVDRRTAAILEAQTVLKSYYPQALQLVGELNTELALAFLRRWPDLIRLKLAKPATIKRFYYEHQIRSEDLIEQRLKLIAHAKALTTDDAVTTVAILHLQELLDQIAVFEEHLDHFNAAIKKAFASHPNAFIFRELPGAGPQLAPRLAVAFGTIYSLYPDAASLQKFAGIAPVREKSGSQLWTHWRWMAPTFTRQTFIEWAGQTILYSAWAKAYYQRMRKQDKKHAVIMRALAFKWLRILWRCWVDQKPYDEQLYLKQLAKRKSPYAVS